MTTVARTLLVTCGTTPVPEALDHPTTAGRIDGVDMYDFADAPLERYAGLLLSLNSDQRELLRLRPKLEKFLARGGTLVFCGHVAYPFLPELAEFQPLTGYRLDDIRVVRLTEHPVFAGVDPHNQTFRKGVAGFYGRGHNPPPPGAVALNGLGPRRMPVDFVYDRPGGGRVLIHAGVDLWGYVDDVTSMSRVPAQLLDWIESRAA